MLGVMHMPPPPCSSKKLPSLHERMSLQKPSQPHASVYGPDAQHTRQCQAAPQENTPTTHAQQHTEQLPPSALDDPPTSAGASGHVCASTHEADNQVQSTVKSAATRPGEPEDCKKPAVVQPHHGVPGNEESDDDLTQEDMPMETVPELPDLGETPQPLHQQPSPQQSKSLKQSQSELGTKQALSAHDESAELHQHAVEGACADDDDEACWEQALEAEMQGLTDRADDRVSGQQCSDAGVTQLDVESADDLLDVLADAAAQTLPARCITYLPLLAQLSCHKCLFQQSFKRYT